MAKSNAKIRVRIHKGKEHDYPKSEDAWTAYINNLHDAAIRDRRPYEFQWALNISYYQSFQHLVFHPETGTLTRDYDNEQYVVNRIAPFVESRVAKIIRTKPILGVIPESLDKGTQKAAELSQYLLQYLHKKLRKDEINKTHAFYTALCGCGFKKLVWNPDLGEKITREAFDSDGRPIFSAKSGKREMTDIFLGEIEQHVMSPFAILASPGTRSVEEAEWIMERQHRPVSWIRENFPWLDIDQIERSIEMTNYESFVSRLASPVFAGLAGYRNRERQSYTKEDQAALIKEIWMKPNKYYPKGLVGTVIGNQLIELKEWPYEHMKYPYIKTDEHENPFSFYGTSTVTRLIPLQRHYNQARTQISKNAELMANGKWLAPKGHGMNDDALTDEEGEVVEYNPNVPAPRQAEIAPLPNYIIQNFLQDVNDIRDIGGERELTQLPFQGITAGVALETAAEQAEIGLVPIMRNFEQAYIKEGIMELELANEFYKEERKLKVFGESNRINVVKFTGLDLRRQYDVQIQVESGFGYSKAAQRQAMMDLWDRRIIADPKQFLKAYVTGDADIILKAGEHQENMVIEHIEMIKNGKQPPVQQFDNHIMFVKMLSEFVQTPEFSRMPEDRQQLGYMTLQAHLQFLQQGAAQQQQQNPAAVNTPFGQQRPEGAPGGPGQF